MTALRVSYLWHALAGAGLLWWALWIGLALLTIALVVLMRTRWGQSEPLGKCLALSLLAHVLMAGYATTVQIVHTTIRIAHEHHVRISEIEGTEAGDGDEAAGAASSSAPATVNPWDALDKSAVPEMQAPVLAAELTVPTAEAAPPPPQQQPPLLQDLVPTSAPQIPIESPDIGKLAEQTDAPKAQPAELATQIETAVPENQPERPADLANARPYTPPLASPDRVADQSLATGDEPPRAETEQENQGQLSDGAADRLVDVDAHRFDPGLPQASSAEPPPPVLPDALLPDASSTALAADQPEQAKPDKQTLDPAQDPAPPVAIPQSYQQRLSDRLEMAIQHGGSKETEAAVNAALAWLAKHQSSNGGWDAARHGAGQEKRVGGEDRHGAGAGADTGVTGLALLAFLGAGQTQLQGEHQESVRRGLEFLIANQAADGNLSGRANLFARMYCHAMATVALGEAYGLSADDRLRDCVRRAIAYTLKAQHRPSGGWRYQPNEPGDTSQLGWQLMGLRSAELAGIAVPNSAKEGIGRFLASVTSGANSGLASYRPGEQATRPMTAEALACRQFLGLGIENAAAGEAAEFIVRELPGTGQTNLYFWYYATLGLYQLGGSRWEAWNSALKSTLLANQIRDGDMAGSWDTNDVWGGYGGRVYTTAVGALCLEVYYRYLPLYGHPIARTPRAKPMR